LYFDLWRRLSRRWGGVWRFPKIFPSAKKLHDTSVTSLGLQFQLSLRSDHVVPLLQLDAPVQFRTPSPQSHPTKYLSSPVKPVTQPYAEHKRDEVQAFVYDEGIHQVENFTFLGVPEGVTAKVVASGKSSKKSRGKSGKSGKKSSGRRKGQQEE